MHVEHLRRTSTTAEVADTFGVSRRTIERRIADGTIRAIRFGPRLVRIAPEEIARLMRG